MLTVDPILTDPTAATSGRGTNPAQRLPLPAAVLGAGGALPFAGLIAAQAVGIEPFGRPPLTVLALYAAVILSFMGAIHWGLAMAEYGGKRDATWSYLISVVPALTGWFAISFLPQPVAFGVIAASFGLLLLYDLRALRLGRVPRWYAKLRWPLTLIVIPSLVIAALMT